MKRIAIILACTLCCCIGLITIYRLIRPDNFDTKVRNLNRSIHLITHTFPFQDTTLTIDERVEDLLSRLTLDEKLNMMEHCNPAIPSLGLPAYNWWNEALHGIARNGLATVWPMPIALAASFDEELVRRVFAQTAYEARMKYLEALDTNSTIFSEPTTYTGLTFFTPNINIFRDPRWGRGMETYGEDPFLTARMGLACVNGLQHNYSGNDTSHLSAAACLKHLAVHSGPEGVRHEFDARVSPRDMWTTYLPAFEYIIKNSDVQQVMCGYNRLNGEPCCTNRELLVDILRNKWHFDGMMVTDCWALNDCWDRDTVIPRHKTHATPVQAAADAFFSSEVDLECGNGLDALRTALDSGYISEEMINRHVRRILRTRLRVMEMSPTATIKPSGVSPADVALSSLVLLKNHKDLLPLSRDTKIYLTGPNATDTLMPLGNYSGTPKHTVGLQEGLESHFTLVDSPKKANVIVYAGGLNPELEGEQLSVNMPGFDQGDRTLIELPENQRKEIIQLQRNHKPVVLLLCSGSAIALDNQTLKCNAIMQCWYGGQDMGTAVAKALLGNDNFGRLPVTFYKSTSQLPPYESYDMAGRTYRYMTEEPLYPFGYGLNYAKYRLENVLYKAGKVCGVVVMEKKPVKKTFGSSTVVEVYLKGKGGSLEPRKQLVGFKRVSVTDGVSQTFDIDIDPYWLRMFNEETQEMAPIPAGSEIVLQVGFSSADKDLIDIIIR